MAHADVIGAPARRLERVVERSQAIPWYLWAGLLAGTCAVIGGHWDISWHRSIGRDTFWTPAHMLIYLCGIIAGVSGSWVMSSHTFGRTEDGVPDVRIWGFRAPLGIFMGLWGAVAMLTSAPFDNWWHNAYGLDVKILSPPHVVLIIGLMAIEVGALIQVLAALNRASGDDKRVLEWMFLYGGAVIFIAMQTVTLEYSSRTIMHQSLFYKVTAAVSILVLAGLARASGHRWAATVVALAYTVTLILMILIFPLFPAEPKLGPVYQQVKIFIPPPFPLLLVFPAIALDLLLRRFSSLGKWKLSALAGVAFLAVYAAVQWPFADFLQSTWARNRLFGTQYIQYNIPPTSYYARFLFVPPEPVSVLLAGMAAAALLCALATRVSLGWGDWMRKIQR